MAKGNFLSLYLVVALMLANGSRITQKQQFESIGLTFDPWEQGTKYACMQKYSGKNERMEEEFCLVKVDDELCQVKRGLVQFAEDWRKCESEADSPQMKVCTLIGEGHRDLRISMKTQELIPKSCFHVPRDETVIMGHSRIFASFADPVEFYEDVKNQWGFQILKPHMEMMTGVKGNLSTESRKQWTQLFLEITQRIYRHTRHFDTTILEAAVTEPLCRLAAQSDASSQSIFVPGSSKLTIPIEEPPICEAMDGYEAKIFGRECIYVPAPCKITGAIGDGLECQCMPKLTGKIEWMGDIPRGECFAEIVQLFDDEAKRWEYSGKDVKCCVSSDGKPTEIVDMNAEELPHARSVGHPTGCGRMFGDTYHNGLGEHFDIPSCLVAITKVMDMIGTDLATVLSLVPDPITPRLVNLSRIIDDFPLN